MQVKLVTRTGLFFGLSGTVGEEGFLPVLQVLLRRGVGGQVSFLLFGLVVMLHTLIVSYADGRVFRDCSLVAGIFNPVIENGSEFVEGLLMGGVWGEIVGVVEKGGGTT